MKGIDQVCRERVDLRTIHVPEYSSSFVANYIMSNWLSVIHRASGVSQNNRSNDDLTRVEKYDQQGESI